MSAYEPILQNFEINDTNRGHWCSISLRHSKHHVSPFSIHYSLKMTPGILLLLISSILSTCAAQAASRQRLTISPSTLRTAWLSIPKKAQVVFSALVSRYISCQHRRRLANCFIAYRKSNSDPRLWTLSKSTFEEGPRCYLFVAYRKSRCWTLSKLKSRYFSSRVP
jgi:hypothetical protein